MGHLSQDVAQVAPVVTCPSFPKRMIDKGTPKTGPLPRAQISTPRMRQGDRWTCFRENKFFCCWPEIAFHLSTIHQQSWRDGGQHLQSREEEALWQSSQTATEYSSLWLATVSFPFGPPLNFSTCDIPPFLSLPQGWHKIFCQPHLKEPPLNVRTLLLITFPIRKRLISIHYLGKDKKILEVCLKIFSEQQEKGTHTDMVLILSVFQRLVMAKGLYALLPRYPLAPYIRATASKDLK